MCTSMHIYGEVSRLAYIPVILVCVRGQTFLTRNLYIISMHWLSVCITAGGGGGSLKALSIPPNPWPFISRTKYFYNVRLVGFGEFFVLVKIFSCTVLSIEDAASINLPYSHLFLPAGCAYILLRACICPWTRLMS